MEAALERERDYGNKNTFRAKLSKNETLKTYIQERLQ